MTGTTVADDYEQVADAFGYDAEVMGQVCLGAIDASWARADEKAALHAWFAGEIAALTT